MRAVGIRVLAACLGAAMIVLLARCGDHAPGESGKIVTASTGHKSARYVGAARCASCHPTEHALWQGSHHDLAMQEVNEQTVLGNFNGASFTHYETTARFSRNGEQFVVETQNADGELTEFTVVHVFGIDPLQQYLVETEGGRLQVLPFCWDARPSSEGGQRWYHLYSSEPIPPGDLLHWTGREQNWNSMCAECHSTGLVRNYQVEENRFDTHYFEMDVSCEACHGPGADHVTWAENPSKQVQSTGPHGLSVDLTDRSGGFWTLEEGAVTRTRTAAPSPDNMLQGCALCHSRRRPLVDGTEPGEHLLETHQLEWIRDPLYFSDGQIRDEVYVHGSFLQSKMHAAGVRCNDCHDPHSLKLRAPGNALCAQCHDPGTFDTPKHHFHPTGSAGASCIACHMPERTYMGIDKRHDHSFRVPRPDLGPLTGAPDTCTSCHEDRSQKWATEQISLHRDGDTSWQKPHFGPTFAAAWSGVPQASEALAGLAMDPNWPGLVRGSALQALASAPLRTRLPVAAQALSDSDPLVRLGALSCFEGTERNVVDQVVGTLQQDSSRAVRIEAARLLAEADAHAELIESFNAAAERPETWLNRGLYELARGDLIAAEISYQRALTFEPRFVGAAVNLADLYRTQGKDPDGRRVLEELIVAEPQAAAGHHALGLLLVRTGESAQALVHLEKAARFAPGDPRFAFVHAVALNDSGQVGVAASVLEAALIRHPGDYDLRFFYTSLLLEQGERTGARLQAEILLRLFPQDRRAEALLRATQD
ncbi:MAG: ammonia-forming cytochrome c nitrite reductase subunit c552 [Planctomycetes bacterium]|nr:ammonia-forming cytochrome c nitrite reductase subunit c552 [Planctomycetota bacterium]